MNIYSSSFYYPPSIGCIFGIVYRFIESYTTYMILLAEFPSLPFVQIMSIILYKSLTKLSNKAYIYIKDVFKLKHQLLTTKHSIFNIFITQNQELIISWHWVRKNPTPFLIAFQKRKNILNLPNLKWRGRWLWWV